MTRRLFVIGLAVMTTALGLLLLWQFRVVIVYVLFSLALAAAVRPLMKRLTGRSRVGRLVLVFLFLLILGGLGFLLAVSVQTAAGEIQRLGSQVAVQDEWQLPNWLAGTPFQTVLAERLPAPSAFFAAITGDQGQLVLSTLLGIIVAPPVSAACQVLWSRLVSHRAVLGQADQISDLKERQIQVWHTIQAMEAEPPPLVTSSLERLTDLLERAEPTLNSA